MQPLFLSKMLLCTWTLFPADFCCSEFTRLRENRRKRLERQRKAGKSGSKGSSAGPKNFGADPLAFLDDLRVLTPTTSRESNLVQSDESDDDDGDDQDVDDPDPVDVRLGQRPLPLVLREVPPDSIRTTPQPGECHMPQLQPPWQRGRQ